MRITIEPETDEEKEQYETVIFEHAYDYLLIGRRMGAEYAVNPSNFWAWNGDAPVLIGKAEEVKERIRNANST